MLRFSGFEGLKIAIVIQLMKYMGCPLNLLGNPFYFINFVKLIKIYVGILDNTVYICDMMC